MGTNSDGFTKYGYNGNCYADGNDGLHADRYRWEWIYCYCHHNSKCGTSTKPNNGQPPIMRGAINNIKFYYGRRHMVRCVWLRLRQHRIDEWCSNGDISRYGYGFVYSRRVVYDFLPGNC